METPFHGRPPARELAIVAAILAGLIALFFPDVVFGGRTISSSAFQYGVMGEAPPFGFPETQSTVQPRLFLEGPDYNYYLADPLAAAVASEPVAEEVSRALRAGRAPLWSSSWGGGHPPVAMWAVDAVSPLRLPVVMAPTPVSWDVFFLVRLLVAGMFTYLLARRLGIVELGSLLAAVAFTFSGYLMLFINMPHVDFAMMLPVVLYTVDLLVERGTPTRFALGVLVVAAAVLSDNPRTAFVMLLLAAAFAVFRLMTAGAPGRRARRGALLGAALALGIGLTGWAVLPFLEYSDPLALETETATVAGEPPRLPAGLQFNESRRMIGEVVPYFEGAPTFGFTELNTGVEAYLGASVLFLASLGIAGRRTTRPVALFFLLVLVLVWAKAYGSLAVAWIGNLPLFDQVRFDKYLPPVAALSAAMLAGLGLDRLIRQGWRTWWVIGGALGLSAAVVVLLIVNRNLAEDLPPGHLALQLSIAGGALGIAVVVALLASRQMLGRRAASILLLGVVTLELLVATFPVKRDMLPGFVRAAYEETTLPLINRAPRHDPFTEPPFVTFLRRDASTFRIFGMGRILYPNTAMAFDLDDIRLFAPIPIHRYWRYVKAFINPSLTSRFTGAPHLASEALPPRILDNEMFDLLNVKYVLARRVPEAKPIRRSAQFTLMHEAEGISVFRNNDVLPRAFLVHDVRRAAGLDDAIAAMRRSDFDPRRSVVLEGLPPTEAFPAAPASDGAVTIRTHEDHRVVIDVETESRGVLVLTDTFYAGWKAHIDGRETRIYPADAAFRGVIVPPGRHRIEYVYAPASFGAGMAVALLSIVVVVGYVLLAKVRGRHRGAPGRERETDDR